MLFLFSRPFCWSDKRVTGFSSLIFCYFWCIIFWTFLFWSIGPCFDFCFPFPVCYYFLIIIYFSSFIKLTVIYSFFISCFYLCWVVCAKFYTSKAVLESAKESVTNRKRTKQNMNKQIVNIKFLTLSWQFISPFLMYEYSFFALYLKFFFSKNYKLYPWLNASSSYEVIPNLIELISSLSVSSYSLLSTFSE